MATESFDDFTLRLQERFCTDDRLALDDSPRKLFMRMRGFLRDASAAGALTSSIADIFERLKWVPDDGAKGRHTIGVGPATINAHRDPALPHLRRDDGGWFDFGLTVEASGKGCKLLSYRYEIRFPDGRGPGFLRLDLNPPDHDNADDGLRSHWHPGHDDLQLPAPVLAPIDALQIMVHGLRRSTDRKPRVKGL